MHQLILGHYLVHGSRQLLQSLTKYIETITKICFSYHSDSFKIDSPLPKSMLRPRCVPDSTLMLERVFFSLVSTVLWGILGVVLGVQDHIYQFLLRVYSSMAAKGLTKLFFNLRSKYRLINNLYFVEWFNCINVCFLNLLTFTYFWFFDFFFFRFQV